MITKKKVLLCGPSATGKTSILNELKSKFNVVESDTFLKPEMFKSGCALDKLVSDFISLDYEVVNVPVIPVLIRALIKYKQHSNLWEENIYCTIYLRTQDPDAHKKNILKPTASAKTLRPASSLDTILRSASNLDPDFIQLCDFVFPVDKLEITDLVEFTSLILNKRS